MANNQKTQQRKRKTVESTFADKWDPENEGDVLEGVYLGKEVVSGGRDGDFVVYHITGEDGKRWSVAGAQLESIMRQIPRNTYVWIEYLGETKVKKGLMKNFRVDVEDGVNLVDPYEAREEPENPPVLS